RRPRRRARARRLPRVAAMTARMGDCARCRSPIETGDLRCAICGCAAPMEMFGRGGAPGRAGAPLPGWGQGGAAGSYSAEARGARCGFCASVMRVEEPVDPIEAADWVLPFAVDPGAAEAALRAWMKGLGWFRPSDLASASAVTSMRPLYW